MLGCLGFSNGEGTTNSYMIVWIVFLTEIFLPIYTFSVDDIVPYISQFFDISSKTAEIDGVLLKMLSLWSVLAIQHYITLGALISSGQCCEWHSWLKGRILLRLTELQRLSLGKFPDTSFMQEGRLWRLFLLHICVRLGAWNQVIFDIIWLFPAGAHSMAGADLLPDLCKLVHGQAFPCPFLISSISVHDFGNELSITQTGLPPLFKHAMICSLCWWKLQELIRPYTLCI